ncbi:MAG: ABC transporter permease [Methylacidiphilales bacterium]|nr:ABC transporter permease [Candidatus Methylacidiphilales bacterium]
MSTLSKENVYLADVPVLVSPDGVVDQFETERASRLGQYLRTLRPGLVLAGLFVFLLSIAAIEPAWFISGDPLDANAREAFAPPSSGHLLGTDEIGRDVLTRVIYGSRSSLLMGLGATAIGLGFGIALGLTAGLGPPVIDGLLMRFVDVLLAFPDLLLALVVITFFGQGTVNAILAVGIASVPRYARLVRAQTHLVRGTAYVEAAKTLGIRSSALIWHHVLPNAIKPVLILATIGIGGKIASGASLSFLGFGTLPPAPEWGAMLAVGRDYLENAWWLTAVPGIAITLTVLSVTALGRELLRRSEGKSI